MWAGVFKRTIFMNQTFITLEAKPRNIFGKKLSARRRLGIIPANIIAKGQDSQAIEVDLPQLKKVLAEVGYTQVLELSIENKKKTVLVSEIDTAPTQSIPQHVVFIEVTKGQRVNAEVPVVLVGEAPGALKGLIILQMIHQIEVEAPALSIPEQFEVDISSLADYSDVVRVADIKLPEDIEVQLDHQTPIVRLEIPRSQVAAEAETEADQTDNQTETDSVSSDSQNSQNTQEADQTTKEE